MKVLDVDLLQEGLQRNITMIERLNTEIETIQRAVEEIVQMGDQLKGDGGNAIRSFYEECHLPFLQFFQLFSYDAQQVLYQIGKALHSLEPDLLGYILEEFLEGELEQGLTLIGKLTASLTAEANSIMDQVSDIVALPHLNDSTVQEGVISSKRKRDDTLSQLYEFDATQTTALNTMEQDIRTMETWLSDIEGMFKSGLTDVHFQADNWGALTAKNNLKTELASRTSPVAVLSFIVNRENQLTTMLQSFIAGNGPIRFGYGGLIGIYNPFVGTDMMALSCARPENSGSEKEDIDQNIFVKSFNSFKGIAEDFWDGVRIRREKALDSPYDFVNYWTFGASGGIVSGANERSAKMFDSKRDFLNYATFGFSGMVKEAIFPNEPFSKEHWQNSFGLVGSLLGLKWATSTASPVKTPGNGAGDGRVTNKGENVTESTSETNIGKIREGISKDTGKYTGGRTQIELDDLAGDPSHGGKIREQGLKEREIGLDLEQQGKLGKIVRDPQGDGGAEFIDTTNSTKWDVKSFVSYPNGHTSPKKGAFTVSNGMKGINKELEKNYNVIVDVRDMVPEHVEQLKEAIDKAGVSTRIIWYP